MTLRVGVYTSGRQDWGIFAPVVGAMHAHPGFDVQVIAGGLHHRGGQSPRILNGIPVAEQVDSLQASDTALGIAQTAGWTTALLAGSLERLQVDALMLVGDRTETLAAAVAATCLRLPVIHLHGGEETEGAVDNACRHAISKLAHLHFVAHTVFRERLLAMGENPARVIVTGAPSLDRLRGFVPMTPAELAARLGVTRFGTPLIAMTYHPTTLGGMEARTEVEIVLAGLDRFLAKHLDATVVATRPNADEGGCTIYSAFQNFAAARPQVILVESLGDAYFSLLRHADLMFGNSSSGILEAPSFGLPTVNVGDRQAGRLRGTNVIDVALDPEAIHRGLCSAVSSKAFAEPQGESVNPYGDGQASRRILTALLEFAPELQRGKVRKPFHSYNPTTSVGK